MEIMPSDYQQIALSRNEKIFVRNIISNDQYGFLILNTNPAMLPNESIHILICSGGVILLKFFEGFEDASQFSIIMPMLIDGLYEQTAGIIKSKLLADKALIDKNGKLRFPVNVLYVFPALKRDEVEYNNVKRDGNNVEGALETPINVELRKEKVPEFKTRKMTGDESFQDVREVLAMVENTDNVFDGINLIAATSMISHGVDADRFNVMFFYGIPDIQAYSRTGRKYSSVVIDIIRSSRETDRSCLNNFVNFHKFKDILVEPVPINRWAIKAIGGTLPRIFTGLPIQHSVGSLFKMRNIKKAIQQGLIQKDAVLSQLLQAYGCEENGNIVGLGNQYRESIETFINNVFTEIVNRSWTEEGIFDGFNLIGHHIMNSLRDTDAGLIIELLLTISRQPPKMNTVLCVAVGSQNKKSPSSSGIFVFFFTN